MPNLSIEYVEKKTMAEEFAQRFTSSVRGTIVSSYPQVEAHALTFTLLTRGNSKFQIVSGVTAGPQERFEELYNTQTPLEKYNFDRNNFARILFRLQEHYSSAK